ncbi:hypothetical protein, partial [Escherichia coli]|uniref:hypothetical protein n=1 Tax=Escherichia coli TaxID=562 RepID=UPI001BC86829
MNSTAAKITWMAAAFILGASYVGAGVASKSIMEIDEIVLHKSSPGPVRDTLKMASGWVSGHIIWGDDWKEHEIWDEGRGYRIELYTYVNGKNYGTILPGEYIDIDSRCNNPSYSNLGVHRCLQQHGVHMTRFGGPVTGDVVIYQKEATPFTVVWEAARCPGCRATMNAYLSSGSRKKDPPIIRTECKMTTPADITFNFQVSKSQLSSQGLNKTQTLNIVCQGGDGALIKIQPPGPIRTGPIAA